MVTADEELRQWGADRMGEIEDLLLESAVADTPFVTEVARHIPAAGGKRFRPMLVVLTSTLGFDAGHRVDPDLLRRAGVVIELTHVASLYHDDVMDEADLRRGAPSANSRYQNSVAIMVGDFLFSRASSIVATMGTDYVAIQADTFARLVQGQIAELLGAGADEDPLDYHLRVVADKTGSLISAAARFGGMVAGLGEDDLTALTAFGEEIGTVFQLSDDLIDITSGDSGKTPGTDLREGVRTLATLLLDRRPVSGDARLRELIADPVSEADLPEALSLLRAHPVIDEARAEITRRAEIARGHLDRFPDSAARRGLADLCDTVVTRTS